MVDIGGATTNVAVYEEGDLQYAAVIPMGGINITNDLAIVLKTDPEIAEKLKVEQASAMPRGDGSGVSLEFNNEIYSFSTKEIDEVVEARLEEIFEAVNNELVKAGRAGKLPSGVVLTGGSAQLKGIAEYAKEALGLAARIGKASGYGGVADNIDQPQYATAIGLMLIDGQTKFTGKQSKNGDKKLFTSGVGSISKFFGRFKF